MGRQTKHFFAFGAFRLDLQAHRLVREGVSVPLAPKALEALLVLVQHAGEMMKREELIRAVWADTFVEDANLTVAISQVRKALGQNGHTAEYIETVPRVGYRFVAEVHEVREEPRPLIIEKHTRSQIVIEEELLPDHATAAEALTVRPRSSFATALPVAINRRHALIATGIVLFLALGPFLYFRRGNERAATASNFGGAGIRSIAVLPPRLLQNELDNASLSLGIADALITRLGGIHQLVVCSASAIGRYSGTSEDPLNAGRALGVDAVLDGTLQRNSGRTRVILRLLNVANGTQLWAGNFEEADADIFKLQDSVSQRVAEALFANLSQEEKALLTKPQPTNPESYALYLKGNYFWNKRGPEAAKSVEYFRKAIELDQNFAQAYVALATVDAATASIPSPEAEALIDKALQLDNTLAEAHATYGFIRMFHHWDWAAAERELDRAIELDPNSSTAHHWKGVYLSLRGRLDEAKAEMHRALELDPLSLIIMADIGQLHYFAHEYDQALDYCNRALALDPEFWVAHEYLLDIYRMKSMDQEALDEYLKLYYRTGTPEAKQRARQVFARGGMRAVFTEQLGSFAHNERSIVAIVMAKSYSRLGNHERALYWLERAVTGQKFFWTPYISVDPLYDPLRDDPPFQAILRRMGVS